MISDSFILIREKRRNTKSALCNTGGLLLIPDIQNDNLYITLGI